MNCLGGLHWHFYSSNLFAIPWRVLLEDTLSWVTVYFSHVAIFRLRAGCWDRPSSALQSLTVVTKQVVFLFSTIKVQVGLTTTLVTFWPSCKQILLTKSECICWLKRPGTWAVERTPFLVCKFVICRLDNLIEQLQLANRHWSNTLIAIKRLRCMFEVTENSRVARLSNR